jgi:outer membrane protein assembly factor BamB
MTTAENINGVPRKPLRLWPGVVIVALQWLAWMVLPVVVPEAAFYGILGGIFGGGLAIIIWWLFFSRAPWLERLGAIILMPLALYATSYLVHESIANGAMGMMLPLYAIPVLCLALVSWAVASRRLSSGLRWASLVAVILTACGVFTLVRTGGMSGEGDADLHWRWTQTPEDRLLEASEGSAHRSQPTTTKTVTLASSELPVSSVKRAPLSKVAEWPGFRGQNRDGVVSGIQIATDWSRSPPVELWRRAIGPGWSSFAVEGDRFYTQEQRGDEEVVACYGVSTGEPIWTHVDRARFWESNAGAGPRATPTLSNGRVYTLGATGIVNALDAADGSVVWSGNAAADTGAKLPHWAFAGSPLVVDNVVVVATAGKCAAYDLATGKRRWLGPTSGGGYSSPHLATIGGVKQILLLNGAGVTSVAVATGKELWKYAWEGDGIVQPAITADGHLLLGSGSGLAGGTGVRCIAVTRGPHGWTTQERWTSVGLKPYFNDFVVHKGHAFGFDGSMLACIDLAEGKRKWKGGRYGHGQLIALCDQDLLLVLSEKGELALVEARGDDFKELARLPAIKGKTWNHPVLAGDMVLVRNGEEMAAYRVSVVGKKNGSE